jgi:hypothetical protein
MGPDLALVLGDLPMKGGQTRRLHFGEGTDSDNDVYLGFCSNVVALSLQSGAHVVLIAPPQSGREPLQVNDDTPKP